MSAILKMLEAVRNETLDCGDLVCDALPDIRRLVQWVERAEHKPSCGMWWEKRCDCGLKDIQTLLRS